VTRAELQREFRELKKKLRKTIVFVTHDLHEGLMMADRIGLMAGGKLIAVLRPADFLRAEQPEIKSLVAVYRARTEFDA
jgi:osmoprotectant transport system ATP-binding protein